MRLNVSSSWWYLRWMASRPTYVGGLGFSLKWNMGWMNDTRHYMHKEAIHRKYHHDELTFSLIYAFTENFVPRSMLTRFVSMAPDAATLTPTLSQRERGHLLGPVTPRA